MFHVDKQLRNEMLEKYYTFDAIVAREFMGKRLTEKMRPALADLSNRVGVLTKSITRQFENIRCIYKRATSMQTLTYEGGISVLDESSTGASGGAPAYHSSSSNDGDESMNGTSAPASRSQDLVAELVAVFQIPKRLARKYTRIIYAAVHQFDLDKKKLQHLKYKDIDTALAHMIKYWGSLPGEGVPAATPRTGISLTMVSTITNDKSNADANIEAPPSSSRRESKQSPRSGSSTTLTLSSPPNLDHSSPLGNNGAPFGDTDGQPSVLLAHTDGVTHSYNQNNLGGANLTPASVSGTVSGSNNNNSSTWYSSPSEMYPMLAPHPKIVSRLNSIKALISSHKAELNHFVDEIRKKLGDWKDQDLASAAPDPSRQSRAESLISYKFIKGFFHIGTSLGTSKDFKKIFSDILEDVVQPCVDAKLSMAEVSELFSLLQIEGQAFITAALGPSGKASSKTHLCDAWHAYVTGLKRISIVLASEKFE